MPNDKSVTTHDPRCECDKCIPEYADLGITVTTNAGQRRTPEKDVKWITSSTSRDPSQTTQKAWDLAFKIEKLSSERTQIIREPIAEDIARDIQKEIDDAREIAFFEAIAVLKSGKTKEEMIRDLFALREERNVRT